MRFRLVLFLSALVSVFSVSTGAALAGDKAVLSDDPFRLDSRYLEPGCHVDWASAHIDVGDSQRTAHVRVRPRANYSVDQVLVPGKNSGYVVYNTFDTGTIATDPDIDPDQTAVNLAAAGTDNVAKRDIVVCVSDHEDVGQNEPYEQASGGQVAAINRPIIQPLVSALGVSAIEGLNTYKIGFGYSIERWYLPHTITDMPAFTLPLTDPQAFGFVTDGLPTHVWVPTRTEQPGVRRINDIDDFGEQFADPHFEKADHGQPEVFHRNGDPYAYLHNSVTAPDGSGRGPFGLLTFTTEGDLPISWSVKASLAPERYLREVALTDDQLRAWDASWQRYYRGEGPKPTLALAPGTNSPAPRAGVIVNPPVSAPAGVTNTTVVQASASCVSGRTVRVALHKKARKGSIRYIGAKGSRSVMAKRSQGRLRATADFRGMTAQAGSYAAVTVREKMQGEWHRSARVFKLC